MRRRVVRFEMSPRFGSETRCSSEIRGLPLISRLRRQLPPEGKPFVARCSIASLPHVGKVARGARRMRRRVVHFEMLPRFGSETRCSSEIRALPLISRLRRQLPPEGKPFVVRCAAGGAVEKIEILKKF